MLENMLDLICWGAVVLVWVVGAVYNYCRVTVVRRRTGLLQLWPVTMYLALWLIGEFTPGSFWSFMTYKAGWLRVTGAALLIAAAAFTIWSRVVLGRMWDGSVAIKAEHRLLTTGPYRITRNPIYTGILLMIAGSMFMYGFGWVVIAFIAFFVYFAIKIRLEERLLTETFGEEFLAYKRRTPRLLPNLKSFKAQND